MSAEKPVLWYRSLRLHLVLAALLVEVVMLSLLLANSYRLINEALTSQARARIESLSPLLEAALAGRVFQRDRNEIEAIIDDLISAPTADLRYLVVLDEQGNLLAQAGGVPAQQLTMEGIGEDDLISALTDLIYDGEIPLRLSGHTVGCLRYGLSLHSLVRLRDAVLRQSLLIAGIEIFLSAFLLGLVGYFLTRNLKTLLAATQRIARADFSQAIDIASDDEVGQLAQSFNRMQSEIRQHIEVVSQSEQRFRTVFDAVGEAIFIHDAQTGKILDVNRRACEMYGCTRVEAIEAPFERFLANVPPYTVAEAQERLHQARQAGRQTFEWLGRRYDNGELLWEEITLTPARLANSDCILAIVRDISERKRLEQTLEFQAFHDPLTRLPNRVLFADRMRQAMARSRRNGKLLAVAMLDLDGFKPVNDRYGHDIGDRVLVQLAQRLSNNLRDEDTISRLGGDEFAFLLSDLDSIEEARQTCRRLLELFAEPFHANGHAISLTASIGLTLYPTDANDADALLRHADQAMYQAKQAGRNRYHFFDAEHDRRMQERHVRLARFAHALEHGELCLYYQPQVNLAEGRVIGAEALLRWRHPTEGVLPPARFLADVEDSDQAVALGEWVLDTALCQMAEWHRQGLALEIGINIGARHLQLPDFVGRLEAHFVRHRHLPPSALTLEIVESVALADIERVSRIIDACHAIGVNIALDDFGTGYSSLAYFKHLRIDTVKIDKSFVKDLLEDDEDRAIVAAVIALASSLKRRVIAEGVENDAISAHLIAMGCSHGQGYGIARPMPAEELPPWINDWHKRSQQKHALLT